MPVAALYRRGPRWKTQERLRGQPEIDGHLRFLRGLFRNGTVEQAGAFWMHDAIVDDELVGLVVLTVETIDEARAALAGDPALVAGVMTCELRPWYR